MSELDVIQPMRGCEVVTYGGGAVLFGQPPEVLKALLKSDLGTLDALVLPDIRERSGVLLNNLEFLLYFFLFFDHGLEHGRRLKLIGDPDQISQVLEMLRLALLGPTAAELEGWGTDTRQAREWLESALFFALKDERGLVRTVPSLFEVYPFVDDVADAGVYRIERIGADRYDFLKGTDRVTVDLSADEAVAPPYAVTSDHVPAGLVKFGMEVLGGASGFSTEAPSTGFALCYNGRYLLIDAIPFLDQHLEARGISKNQISALFLTHLHDDHCNMFPLMLMPHKVDVITTREIFRMAMRKLALGLGWTESAVEEHFNFVELRLREPLNYYGLEIHPHHTVHSIPTVGAVFRATQHGQGYEICLVGDIQTFAEIAQMRAQGLVRPETEQQLHTLYTRRFDLLIADGGMGPIHGDPADALGSASERVVFVHVDELPEEFNATFSLASSGKRYTIIDGDSDIYTTRTIELLMANFRQPLASRWLTTLFADKTIKRYNTDDVIIKQGAETWGNVFLILTGYCEVIHHDGSTFSSLATREAGDLMGEMAVITGSQLRSASVVARTPVTVCEFSEDTFNACIEEQGLKRDLIGAWSRRAAVSGLPQFAGLSTTVIDALCAAAEEIRVPPGGRLADPGRTGYWTIVSAGQAVAEDDGSVMGVGSEVGANRPHARPRPCALSSAAGFSAIRFETATAQRLVRGIPHLNYALRKFRATDPGAAIDWELGEVPPGKHSEYQKPVAPPTRAAG